MSAFVGKPIPLGDAWDLTVGAGSVWVAQFDGRLVRFDERTGRIQARIRPQSGGFGTAVAFGGGSIWTSSHPAEHRRASLVRVDPETNRVAEKLHPRAVDARTQTIAFGDGAVWLFDHDHFLVKVDPETLRVLARREVNFGVIGMIPTRRSVFLADPQGQRLATADPETGRVLRAEDLDIAPLFPAMGGGSVWTVDHNAEDSPNEGGAVFRIDPRTLGIVQRIELGANPASVSFGQGGAWVALKSGEVVRLGLTG